MLAARVAKFTDSEVDAVVLVRTVAVDPGVAKDALQVMEVLLTAWLAILPASELMKATLLP